MKQTGLFLFVLAVCLVGVMSSFTNIYTSAMNGEGDFSNEGYEKEGSYYVWERDITESLEGIDWGKFDTINGKIEITSHEDSSINEAVIYAKIKIKPSWLSGEDSVLEAKKFYDVTVQKADEKLTVKGVHPKRKPKGISNAVIEMTVTVPKRLNADVQTVNGKVDAEKIDGEMILSTVNGQILSKQCPNVIKVHTTNGSIKLQDLTSLQKAETVNGSIDARFNASPTHSGNFGAVNGSVKLYFPKDAKYSMKVNTVNGGISFAKDRFEGRQKKREVTGTINGGGSELRVSTVNGSVSFRDV